MFVEPTTEVYEGMIIGENSRADDMDVNITKEKQQTNIRSATSDNFEKLIPPRHLSLEQCLEFCRDDECVEVTPDAVRIRKVVLENPITVDETLRDERVSVERVAIGRRLEPGGNLARGVAACCRGLIEDARGWGRPALASTGPDALRSGTDSSLRASRTHRGL